MADLHKASNKYLEIFQKKWILLKWMLYIYAGHVKTKPKKSHFENIT